MFIPPAAWCGQKGLSLKPDFPPQALYMFYALAIVCDDFFVPSLEKICEVRGKDPEPSAKPRVPRGVFYVNDNDKKAGQDRKHSGGEGYHTSTLGLLHSHTSS